MYSEFQTLIVVPNLALTYSQALSYGEYMFKKIKMSYAKIREKLDPSILKSVNETVRRYKKDELRALLLTEDGRAELSEKVYFQLHSSTKLVFKDNAEAKKMFIDDVLRRFTTILDTPKLYKKVFGK